MIVTSFLNRYIGIRYTKNSNNVFNQNLNETKRARFTTFAISIVDNLYLLQQYKCNTIKIPMPRLIINVPYESSFMTILDFFISN